MKYSEIRNSLRTGDIILFSGKGTISRTIQMFTRSKWSHVGMAIRSEEWDMLLSWESTTLSKLKDIQSDTARQGVQLVPLSERIRTYDGDIGIRQLGDHDTKPSYMKEQLMKFRQEVRGRPYEQNKLELIKSAYDGPFGHNEEDLSSIFCSELVAEAYQRMGFLSEHMSSNEYTPADFGRNLNLINASLSDTIEIEI